jgi:D-alanine-D-alanine ligase
MQTVLILCGGESGEHEVSLQSARSIVRFIPRDRYRPVLVGITKAGVWVTGDHLFDQADDPAGIRLAKNLKSARLEMGCLNGEPIDVVFPIIHGTYGEDGCLQGVLQMQHLPYVGAGVLGSALGMDKDIMKRIFQHAGLKCAPYRVLYRWQTPLPSYWEIAAVLGDILFVKPCNLGSSVGISKVKTADDFEWAVADAFRYDNKVIIEAYIKGREIEVSVLGNDAPVASLPGEIIPGAEFYSYDSKYIDSVATQLVIPAELEADVGDEVRRLALQAFRLLECAGLARVDFFVESDGAVWLNEINTLPGFTHISMYPKLWEASGLPYPELIARLIQLAFERYRQEARLMRNRS